MRKFIQINCYVFKLRQYQTSLLAWHSPLREVLLALYLLTKTMVTVSTASTTNTTQTMTTTLELAILGQGVFRL